MLEVKIDYGTPELHKRCTVDKKNNKARVVVQNPLDEYLRRMWIDEGQFLAGDKFFSIFEFSGGKRIATHRITDEQPSSSHFEEEENGMTPQEKFEVRYRNAVRTLPFRLRELAINVCCFHYDISSKPKSILALREALKTLSDHFESEAEKRRKQRMGL